MSPMISPRAIYRGFLTRRDALFLRRLNRHLQRTEPEAVATLQRIIDRYRDQGGLQHPLQIYKLWELERLISRLAPHRILELGTGSTTPVLARYVLAGDGRQLLAIDENPRWIGVTKSLLPEEAAVSPSIELEHRDKIITEGDPPQIRYDPPVVGAFDLVVIDGPSLSDPTGAKIPGAINTNVADLMGTSPPTAVIVDMRIATVRWFEGTFGHLYAAEISDRVKGVRRIPYRYFSVFTRRDVSLPLGPDAAATR